MLFRTNGKSVSELPYSFEVDGTMFRVYGHTEDVTPPPYVVTTIDLDALPDDESLLEKMNPAIKQLTFDVETCEEAIKKFSEEFE